MRTGNELTMICYFREGFKPSIKVEIEQNDRDSIDLEEMLERAVNAEAKAGLRSSIMVRDLNYRCSRGYRLSYNTFSKVQPKGYSYKNSLRSKEPKSKDLKPAPSRDNEAELAKKKARKEMKKKLRNQKWEHIEQISATDVNTKGSKIKFKARWFNCNKKSYYANKCTKSQKNKCRSR